MQELFEPAAIPEDWCGCTEVVQNDILNGTLVQEFKVLGFIAILTQK
jgi:hypothetical protein